MNKSDMNYLKSQVALHAQVSKTREKPQTGMRILELNGIVDVRITPERKEEQMKAGELAQKILPFIDAARLAVIQRKTTTALKAIDEIEQLCFSLAIRYEKQEGKVTK